MTSNKNRPASSQPAQSSFWQRLIQRHLVRSNQPSYGLQSVCLSSVTFAVLLLLRLQLLGRAWLATQDLKTVMPKILTLGYYDFEFVASLTVVFLILLTVSTAKPRLSAGIFGLFCVLSLLILLAGIFNVQVIQTIGRPFTFQWFYYSDFLRSREAQSALFFNLPLSRIGYLSIVVASAWIVARSLAIELQHWSNLGFRKMIWSGTILIALLYLPTTGWYLGRQEWQYSKLVNPIVAFIASYMADEAQPALFTMAVDEPFRSLKTNVAGQPSVESFPLNRDHKIRNVILFVMESVAGEYVDAFGGTHGATPEIDHYQASAALFPRIYAHAPSSNKSLVSMLGAIYPMVSYLSLTEERPDAQLPTLSSELHKAGYRTAFLSASSLDFQRGNEFLAHRQFDIVEDQATLPCAESRHYKSDEWSFLNGVDELCAVERFATWVDVQPQAPFFTMFWTAGTHYPYFTLKEEVDYGVSDPSLNRYLNALHHTDRAIGKLMEELEARGLADSTLVVLVGDHGESFGRHSQLTHASKIYEENIHVPLMLINSSLFHGESYDTIGGLSDIAPTILSILQKAAPDQWQGNSLFRSDRIDRTYFFTPWSDFLFGYREGNMKLIYDATTGTTEIYDLSQDPLEATNLSEQMPERVAAGHEILAAWLQYHATYIEHLLSNGHAK